MCTCRLPTRGSRRSNAEYQPYFPLCIAVRSHSNRPQSWFDNGEARFVASAHMAAGHIRHAFPPTILSDGVMIIDCHDRAERPASVPQGSDRSGQEQVADALESVAEDER